MILLEPPQLQRNDWELLPLSAGPCGEARKSCRAAGPGWNPVYNSLTADQQLSLSKGKRGHVMLLWQPKAAERKLQKAEPIKQPGVSNTLGPPGTGPSSIRGKVSIKSPQWRKGSQGKQSKASHHGFTVTEPWNRNKQPILTLLRKEPEVGKYLIEVLLPVNVKAGTNTLWPLSLQTRLVL